ncbi:MAG: hypothetical protein RIB60_00965 [Phycisphaerales bacterium]
MTTPGSRVWTHATTRRIARILGAIGVLTFAAAGAGCNKDQRAGGDEKNLDDYRDQSRNVFGPGPTDPPADAAPPAFDDEGAPIESATAPGRDAGPNPFASTGSGWSIIIANVPGSNRVIGEQMLSQVRGEGRLPGAALIERGDKLVIAVGSFAEPTSPDAKRELERVQQTVVRGQLPYAGAFLSPPVERAVETGSSYDLRNVKAAFGKDALYTLQVGVYGYADGRTPPPDELALFRKTAEDAVAELRAQGELAFYYHDRARSMVTVGVFGPEDHDASVRPPLESPRLVQARRRHEFNLLNGQGVKQVVRGPDGQRRSVFQKSFLVAIPD